jgi:hypothetical protein
MIHGLVGVAIQAIGLRPLQESVARLDGRTAAAAAREMLQLKARTPSLADTLTWEKNTLSSSLVDAFRHPEKMGQMVSSQGGGSMEQPTDPQAVRIMFWLMPKRQMIDNQREYLDKLIASSRQPYYTQLTPPPMPGDIFSQIMLPIYSDAAAKWTQHETQWRITLTRLAVRAYEQQHGAPPPTLSALVPNYLPRVPEDPYAPHPLVYRRNGRRALVYSRGPDGDDDGGKDLGNTAKRGMDGDVVTTRSPQQR